MMASEDAPISMHRSPARSFQLVGELHQLRKDSLFTDFTIKHGHRSIQCHRVILAANSHMLRTLMSIDMKEATAQEEKLESIPYEVLELLVEYMYTGHITIPSSWLMKTINACKYLELKDLEQQCIQEIPAILQQSNVISWFKLAHSIGAPSIKDQCLEIMCQSFSKHCQEEEFLQLELAEVIELIVYLTHIKTKKVPTDDILNGAMLWVNHDAIHRAVSLKDLINIVTLEDCTALNLDRHMTDNSQLFHSNHILYKYFNKALTSIALRKKGVKKSKCKKKKGTLAMIGGEYQDGPLTTVNHFNIKVNPICWFLDFNHQLSEFTQIPENSCSKYHSVCETDAGFAVTGGEGSKVCVMFHAASRSWAQPKKLLATRHCHGSVCVHGLLFVMGGYVSGSMLPSHSVDYLEVGAEDEWKHTTRLPVAMHNPKVVNVDADVFLLVENTRQLFCMDVQSKSWSSRSPMPGVGHSQGVSTAASSNALYVAGGSVSNHFAWYTPSTDTWSTGTLHSKIHSYGALIHMDDRLYLLGGYQSDDVEVYDIQSRTWSVSSYRMPNKLRRLHSVALDLPPCPATLTFTF